jgi:hypothetical protein
MNGLKQATETSSPQTIGQLVEGRGVYLGPWTFDPKHSPVDVYAAPDFLRDASGNQLILNFSEAVKELTRRNDGRAYGNGGEADLRRDLGEGRYRYGDRVLAPMELLNGYNAGGERVRPGGNVVELLKTSQAFEKLLDAVTNASGDGRRSVSASDFSINLSCVYHVVLPDDDVDWDLKDNGRSGVVPARVFHRANPQPGPAG